MQRHVLKNPVDSKSKYHNMNHKMQTGQCSKSNCYIYCRITHKFHSSAEHKSLRSKLTLTTCCKSFVYLAPLSKVVAMCRTKFVVVFLCLISIAASAPRRLYIPNPDDPTSIAFEGPTNYEDRKQSENEVDDILDLIDTRFGEITVENVTKPTTKPPPADGGFFFPED